MKPLILASTSPYRAALLERLGVPFTCEKSGVDEAPFKQRGDTPYDLALRLAIAKAEAVARKHPEAIVIGGDQTAACEDRILSKPVTFERAYEQLHFLAGKTHYLHSAIAVCGEERTESQITSVALTMRKLDREAVERYLRAEEPFDCAGSYKLESRGITLFETIDPFDESAVIGLPLLPLCELLRRFGYRLP